MSCPNKNEEEYRKLEAIYGPGKALACWTLNGEKSPTPLEAIKLLYGDKVKPIKALSTMDFGDWAGTYEPDHEKEIDDHILNHPGTPINGGDSFNGFQDKALGFFIMVLKNAPANTLIVTHSSVLKLFNLFEQEGRPANLRVDAKKYTEAQTHTGDIEKFKGTNGWIFVERHGETVHNTKSFLRGPDTQLTEKGVKQAENAAKELSEHKIPVVYTSPLDRALHTTDITMAAQDKKDPFEELVGGKYSDIKLAEPHREDFSHIQDFSDRYKAIQDKKQELEGQGAQVSNLGANGFNWVVPDRKNLYFQQSKNIKDELQSIIREAVSGRLQENTIQTATYFFSRSQKENPGIAGRGQDVESLWKSIQSGGFEYKFRLHEERELMTGAEHKVYLNEDGRSVIKIRHDFEPTEIVSYLKELLVHNYLFSNVEYKLLGFDRDAEKIYPIVEQRYVERDSKYFDEKAIDNVLTDYGFINKSDDSAKREDLKYYNDELRITIEDINPRNVFFKDEVPYFIDPIITVSNKFYRDAESNTGHDNIRNLTPPDSYTTKRIKAFVDSTGGRIKYVPQIIVRGKVMDANAVTDILERTIQVADGKEDETTLPEEAGHYYVGLLPEHSILLDDMMKGIQFNPIYDRVEHEYKDNPYYQNEDGSIDEEKIKKEAIGQLIGEAIRKETADRKALSWWQRLWNWIKDIFKGRTFDTPYQEAASDILDKKLSKLDLQKVKEANEKGEIYFQLSDKDKQKVEDWKKGATPIQAEMIDKLVLDNKMSLEVKSHTYKDATDPQFVWKPLTTAIKGHFEDSVATLNRVIGTELHSILEAITLGKSFSEIEPTPNLPDAVRGMAYNAFQELYRNLKEDGSILLTETILLDKEHGIATSVDLIKIKPDGTRKIIDLKTSQKKVMYRKDGQVKLTTEYIGNAYDVKEGSVLGGKLTANQQHGIQVAAQDRILDNMGYINSEEPETYHIQIQMKDGLVEAINVEGSISHPIDANGEFVDKLLGPSLVKDKPVADPGNPGNPTPEDEEKTLNTFNAILDKIKKEFIRRKASALEEMRQTSINELKNTVSDIDKLQNAGQVREAIGIAMEYIKGLTRDSLKFISNKDNFKNRQYYQFLQESNILAASNLELLPDRLRKYMNDTQKAIFDTVRSDISDLQEIAGIRSTEFFLQSVSPPTNNIDIQTLEKEWFPEKGIEDISSTGSWATNFDSLRNPIIREAVNKVQLFLKKADRENVDIEHRLAKAGNDLKLIAGEAMDKSDFWNFMYNLDKDGNPESYINPTGQQYYDIEDRLRSTLLDDSGQLKQYIPIKDLKSASKEDIEYNVSLYHDKTAWNKFQSSEEFNKDTEEIEPGRYHYFTNEYKAERDKALEPLIHRSWEGEPLYMEWVPKKGLTENSPEVKKFRNKYQIKDKYWSMQKLKGVPTGIVVEKEGYFPNRKYSEVNAFAGKEDMRNPAYVKLISPKNDLERAQLDFYHKFIDEFVAGGKKMGGEAERFVANLGIIALQAKVFQKAAKVGIIGTLKHQAVEFFTAVHKSNVEKTDARGVTRMSLRIPYIGSLRSKEKIATIEGKIADLGNKKNSIPKSEYNGQLKELNRQLEIESHKTAPEDIEKDVVKQIIAWSTAANTYDNMERIEGELLAMQYALKEQKFIKNTGRSIQKVDNNGNPVFKSLEDVDAIRAMNQLIKNYYGISMDETNLGVALKRFQNLTSFMVMGLNIFNGLNNTFLYQMNLMGQAVSGRYGLSAKSWALAQKELTTSYIPGLVKSRLNKNLKYGEKRPYSAAEAFMKKYKIKVDQKKAEGAGSFFGKFYIFENIAIDLSQVVLALTGARDIQVTNHDTGETSSMMDAHIYDPNTGSYELKPGFHEEDMLKGVVKIGDIQTQAQGNYQPITQPAMTSTILGALLIQFHRFFGPSWNNRFSKRYTHKTLGETEGSWISALSFIKMLKDYDGSWQDTFNKNSKFWKDAPDFVKRNLMFDAFDMIKLLSLFAIGAVLKGIAEDVPEDDPNQKRWMNFLAYTASRLRFEQQMFNPVFGWVQMGEFVQNPIAMSNTLRTFAEAMYLSTEFPFQSEDDRYYKNGVFVGDSKAAHQWGRIIPLQREYLQWQNRIKAGSAEDSILGQESR